MRGEKNKYPQRQCCGQYRDPTQRDRHEWQRDLLRCRHHASITIYGQMPGDDELLPWIAFLCKRHIENTSVQWFKPATMQEAIGILTDSEIGAYLEIFLTHDTHCLEQIRNWRDSRRTRKAQREELVRLISERSGKDPA